MRGMIALLLVLLVIAVLLAAVNHYLFPIPAAVWFIVVALAVLIVLVLLIGAVDGAELDVGDGRR